MDSQIIKDLAKLLYSEDEVNQTRESGFAEASHEVSHSSIRSRGNLSHVSADEGCFPDSIATSYGRGAILGTAISAGGNNISRSVPDRATLTKYMAQYQGFVEECWRGLVKLQKYVGMLDGNTSSVNFPDEVNLESYVMASQAECARVQALKLKNIDPLVLNWFSLLALVRQDIREERECFSSVRRLRQLVSLVTLGLFDELWERDLIQRDRNEFRLRRSRMLWNQFLN